MQMRSRRFLGGLVAWIALVALVPAAAAAATVSGTVGDESTHAGIAGVDACFRPEPEGFETRCDETDSAGHYEVAGLPEGDYVVRFSADRNNLKYVSEYYDDAPDYFEMDLFTLGPADATIDAELAEGGSIAGTLTDEGTGLPVAGMRACAMDSQGFWPRCADSDANGDYLLNGIPSGTYSVEYEGGNRVNYLHEFYEDAETWAAATDVEVTVPATTSGIDAELAPGAEILGRVTDPGTGAPSKGVFVCANEQEPGEYQGCDTSDENGDYAIRSLPAGAYLVAFELEYFPWGLWAKQWWQGAATMAEADPIVIAPPETRTGIDGQATSPFWFPPPQDPDTGGGTVTPPPPPPPGPKPKPKKCKKGFHRKLVKGKRRCVRKHKKHQQRRKGGSAGKARS
jgi:hypothetical protein